jgi:hypothetical protein
MKVGICSGEVFPIYEVCPQNSNLPSIEVASEVLKKWKRCFDELSAMQKEIIIAMEEQGFGDQVWANGTWNSGFTLNEDEIK